MGVEHGDGGTELVSICIKCSCMLIIEQRKVGAGVN